MQSRSRLLGVAAALAAALAAIGFAAEAWRFGLTSSAAASRLERDVRDRFDRRAQDVEGLARRVAVDTAAAVHAASDRPEAVPVLFDRLNELAPAAAGSSSETATVTVYVPRPEGQYRILAWSDGPAESVNTQDLAGEATVLLVPGTLGLRLISVQPVQFNGARIAAAAAETVLAPAAGPQTSGMYRFGTTFGPVTISFPGSRDSVRQPGKFTVSTAGRTGFDVQVSSDELRVVRMTFRRRALAMAALPLVAAVFLLTAGFVARRRARNLKGFLAASVIPLALVVAGAAALVWLAHLTGASATVEHTIIAFAGLAIVGLLPASLWWRGWRRRRPQRARARFVFEQLATGVGVAGSAWLIAELLRNGITPATLPEWQRPLFPLRFEAITYLSGLFVAELALFWTAALFLALMAGRWRLGIQQWPALLAAVALWLAPALAALFLYGRSRGIPDAPWIPIAILAVLFGLGAGRLRHRYRGTTQAMRLVHLYVALLLPVLALYPVAWSYADHTARGIVANNYAIQTAGRPTETRVVLARAQNEIDALPSASVASLLAPLESPTGRVATLPAFNIWSQTSLSTTRLTSSVELYSADGSLVSRFALNMPEYRASALGEVTRSMPTECGWEVFGEVVPFGAEERAVLHARRQVCDAADRPVGALAVHVMNDYGALPFVSTPDPYRDVLGSPETASSGSILPDLHVVVYGWSYTPIFTSGNVAWPITPDVDERLYRSRQPFWTKLDAEGRSYDVYFSNDRGSVYALGYPTSTWFEHLTRLAEAAALTAVIFIIWLLGAVIYTPMVRRTQAPLQVLLDEVRTNFYRKLFLLFVVAAVGPFLIFALAFGAYMTAQLRADVETEAATVVTVARRVLEQASVSEPLPGAFNDDLMVWVGQVLQQDVNLFEGPELIATSQRDLYASGLLPTRTPAKVYRAIALNRLPSFVAEEWLGPVSYVVAAAPMPAAGREFVLSIPLASRQREIEREIDELNRGVLVGAVFVVLFAAGLGASVAGRVSDPVKRLSDATRLIADDKLDVRLVAETSDELSRLIDDFNTMAARLRANRSELARANQLEAWAEMARQVAHEIKNPLTPIQLATEHLEHVHADRGRPLGAAFDQCVTTILRQVRLLRQIASEFSTFAGQPTPRLGAVAVHDVIEEVVQPYRIGLQPDTTIEVDVPPDLARAWADRTLTARALTNLVENALQAMPAGGTLRIEGKEDADAVILTFADTGVGMDAEAATHAFEPYFSTKTAGSGLGLANARRNIETSGGTIVLTSVPGQGTTVRVTLLRHDLHGAPGVVSTPSQ